MSTTGSILSAAVAGLAKAMRTGTREQRECLTDALILLAECQLSAGRDPTEIQLPALPRPIETNAERFARIARALNHLSPAEQIGVVRARTGWSKSTTYRAKAEACELGLF